MVLPLTYAYATLRQSVAGNSTFWGIILCNFVDIFMCIGEILVSLNKDVALLSTPYIFPYDTPRRCSRWTKNGSHQKKSASKNQPQKFSNSLVAHKLSTFVLFNWFFLFGRLRVPTRRWDLLVPEAGGGGVQTLELYTASVFLVGIWLVFLGIYQTDTGGKLGRYLSVL